MDTTAQVKTSDITKLFNDIERDLLFHIVMSLKEEKISQDDAKMLAESFLATNSARSKDEFFAKLNEIALKYPLARAVYIEYATPHYEENKQGIIDEMLLHIKNGQIEKALSVAADFHRKELHGSD